MKKTFTYVQILKRSFFFTLTSFVTATVCVILNLLPPTVEVAFGLLVILNVFLYSFFKNKLADFVKEYVDGVYDINLTFAEAKVLSTPKLFHLSGRSSYVSKRLTQWDIDAKGHTYPYNVQLEQTLTGKTILFNITDQVEMLTSIQRVSDTFLTGIGQKFHFYALAKTDKVKGIDDFVDFSDPRENSPVIPIWVHPTEIELYKITNDYDYDIVVFEFMDFKRKLIPDACAESAKLTIYSGNKFNIVDPGVLLQYL